MDSASAGSDAGGAVSTVSDGAGEADVPPTVAVSTGVADAGSVIWLASSSRAHAASGQSKREKGRGKQR
ncbi:hypothetical protein [Cohnella faecalis]|uniref:Uncharacterized protein n=1 Tax=Cohnella faecalis TaxID=2315694 RepID=A0A398CI00_9BACL|nr:hypothetical protein [Cohnella faecalis]RIE01965.1 hypothetical protein D3H35_14435 [Cohnella faecalis]